MDPSTFVPPPLEDPIWEFIEMLLGLMPLAQVVLENPWIEPYLIFLGLL